MFRPLNHISDFNVNVKEKSISLRHSKMSYNKSYAMCFEYLPKNMSPIPSTKNKIDQNSDMK